MGRIIGLAKGALNMLQSRLSLCSRLSWDSSFMSSLSSMDAVIDLRERILHQIQTPELSDNSRFTIRPYKNLQYSAVQKLLVNFDPLHEFLQELERFSSMALFFYDEIGGSHIGIVWKPEAFKPKPLKVSNCAYSVPLFVLLEAHDQSKDERDTKEEEENDSDSDSDSGMKPAKKDHSEDFPRSWQMQVSDAVNNSLIVPNVMSIIEEVQTLGRGLVKRVRVRRWHPDGI